MEYSRNSTSYIASQSNDKLSMMRKMPRLLMILEGSFSEKEQLYYSYIMQLKYHMGELLKMNIVNKQKFISIYLYLKCIMQLGLNIISFDQFVICFSQIENWPMDIENMDWTLAQTDKILKNLINMRYYTDELQGIKNRYP